MEAIVINNQHDTIINPDRAFFDLLCLLMGMTDVADRDVVRKSIVIRVKEGEELSVESLRHALVFSDAEIMNRFHDAGMGAMYEVTSIDRKGGFCSFRKHPKYEELV